MSLFHDAGIDPCHGMNCARKTSVSSSTSRKKRPAKGHFLLGSISPPSLPLIVKSSWEWAEDSFNSYRDGLTKAERKERMDREDRKQVLYMRMRNVSITFLFLLNIMCLKVLI